MTEAKNSGQPNISEDQVQEVLRGISYRRGYTGLNYDNVPGISFSDIAQALFSIIGEGGFRGKGTLYGYLCRTSKEARDRASIISGGGWIEPAKIGAYGRRYTFDQVSKILDQFEDIANQGDKHGDRLRRSLGLPDPTILLTVRTALSRL